MIGKLLGKALIRNAAKSSVGKKALSSAQRLALKKAQKESARLRHLAAKNPNDFYANTTVRKVSEASVRLNKKTNTLTIGKSKLMTLEAAKKHHNQIKKQFGVNSNLYKTNELGKVLSKKVQQDAWKKLPTSVKVGYRVGQATKVGIIGGTAGYVAHNTYKDMKKRK